MWINTRPKEDEFYSHELGVFLPKSKEMMKRDSDEQRERRDNENRIRAGERSFALGFNGGTWDDD